MIKDYLKKQMDIMKNRGELFQLNISRKDDYYTQRNNRQYPLSSCFATSDVIMLTNSYLRDEFLQKVPKDVQPEDYLTELLLSDRARDHAHLLGVHPDDLTDIRLYYSMHVWLLNNQVFGRPIVEARVEGLKMSIKEIIFDIVNLKPVVVGGKFTASGHMVCVVGFTMKASKSRSIKKPEDVDESQVVSIIVDDPYGDYFSFQPNKKRYASHKGNDIYFPVGEFTSLISGNALRLL